ncbi:hypothetical protein XI06_15105 [Bradyrhizobium sp. CCBAU 11434]|uniref:hypothetical protein n=1 Tax=Bradyrhizobium sp. CCBAU 11434 TaxID=1630885 RepID=UPI0023053A1C|nr:hypothetical protein [Bradyrhizobium sp. CCBAU 11434]MDA9521636.1 hypothetical protein [Bradyrhizobium sp. CCBAU 11434]
MRFAPNSAHNLQTVSAINYGPSTVASAAIGSATTTKLLFRHPFLIGGGDVSSITLSNLAWYLQKNVGVTALGNGFVIDSCAIEYNGAHQNVTFGGLRNKAINAGDTDIQADPLSASAFGLSAFTQGSIGYIRCQLSFSTPATDQFPQNSYRHSSDTIPAVLFDPNKVSVTNGVDATGPITYSMINSGVDGTDAVHQTNFYTPIVLGNFVQPGRFATFFMAGDSIMAGFQDNTGNSMAASGYTRAMFPRGIGSSVNVLACLNFACPGGIGSDWANGTPAKILAYLKYAKYGIEAYGANNPTVSFSTAIHAQMRAGGIVGIYRISITPSDTSSDSFTTAGGQTYASGYGPGGGMATFNTAMQALVASDFTWVDPLGMRDGGGSGDYWKWFTNGTALYAVGSDGLHPSSNGYELEVGGSATVISNSGTATNNMRQLFASLT